MNPTLKILAALVAVLPFVATMPKALAADDQKTRFGSEFKACMDKSAGATVAVRACTSEELQRQDERLNRAYAQLMRSADDDVKGRLKEAQRAWIQFRDAECALKGAFEGGGTLEAVIIDSCHLSFTAKRADELEALE